MRPKIRIPRTRPQLVIRAGLYERINAGLWRKLTLVCAQPGAGKTTLLAAWASQLEIPVAWLSLDASDAILERFLVSLLSTVETAVPGGGQRALSLLSAPQPLDTSLLLDTLINDLDQQGQELVLVLDDYHTIQLDAIHEAVAYLLEHLPVNLHLVIASRSDPPLPLARLRAKDLVTELDNADLSFSEAEAADFLNRVMGLALDEKGVAALEQRTEGWVTGLQLAALAFRAPSAYTALAAHQGIAAFQSPSARGERLGATALARLLSGDNRYFLDYLTEEVLRQQAAEIQEFLLDTSILERMQADLCQAVTGRADCQRLLRQVEQAHLFTLPLDDQNEWFRYQTFFADLLRYQLERTQPGRVVALRQKAAGWLEEHGYNGEAISQYLKCKDYASAARLAQVEGNQLLAQGQGVLFIALFKSLPVEVFSAIPYLHMVYVCGLISIGQFGMVEPQLQRLEAMIQDAPGQQNLCGEISAVRTIAASATGQYPQAIEESRQALAYLPEDSPLYCSLLFSLGSALNFTGLLAEAVQTLTRAARLALQSGQVVVALSALCNQGNIEQTQGKFQQAQRTFLSAIEVEQGLPARNPFISMAYLGLAEIYYQWNELSQVLSLAEKAIHLADQWGYLEMRALTRLRYALALLAAGEADPAAEVMRQVEEILAQGQPGSGQTGFLSAYRLNYLLRSGQLDRALKIAGELPAVEAELLPREMPLCLMRIKAHLSSIRLEALALTSAAKGRVIQVRDLLARIAAAFRQSGQNAFLLETLIAQALVADRLGDRPMALARLEEAVDLAAGEGILRSFLDFGLPGLPVQALLRADLPGSRRPAFAQRILQAFEVERWSAPASQVPSPERAPTQSPGGQASLEEPETRQAQSMLVEPLTGRELEVLRLVVEGLSNQQIAERLVIAPGTVKRHLHNIFAKLDVSTRPQAIALARKCNLA